MKRILLTLLAATPLFFVACSSDDNKTGEGEGSIVLNSNVNTDTDSKSTRATPTTEFDTYKVMLTGTTTRTVDFPSDKIVSGLPVGTYNVTVASHASMPNAAFDVQYYSGTAEGVNVTANGSTSVPITATQANAGVKFDYDAGFATAGITVVPTVAGTNGTLTYMSDNKDGVGYFAPGTATVTLKTAEGATLLINGKTSETLPLEAKQLWTVKLEYNESTTSGSVKMTITVNDTATSRSVSFNVGEPGGTEGPNPGSPESIDFYVGDYSVSGTYAFDGTLSMYQAGGEGPTLWADELFIQNDQGYIYLVGDDFAQSGVPTFYDWDEEEPEILTMDLYTHLKANEAGTATVCMGVAAVFYDAESKVNVRVFTDDDIDLEWDASRQAVGIEFAKSTYEGFPCDFIIAPFYYQNGNLTRAYGEGYSKIEMKKDASTSGGSISQNAQANHVEVRGNQIAYTKEQLQAAEIQVANTKLSNTNRTKRVKR